MKDYSFGNFICALRMGRGLSQYQLGALVGVTDKAVSKWENGDSKPRLKTCQRLAAVLGVTVNELLSCGYNDDVSAGKEMKSMNEYLWKKAHDQLHKLYGEVPASECWGRLEAEQAVLKETNVIVSFELLGKMMDQAKKKGSLILARGLVGSSFTAWLLGATEINPLPPHYYCSSCGRIEFHREVEDGWDLSEAQCVCGAQMIRDGHDIPFEGYANTLRNSNSVEIDIAPDFCDEAENLIRQFYANTASVIQVELIRDYDVPDNALPEKRFVLFEEETPSTDRDGVLRLTMESFFERFRMNISYTLVVSPDMQMLQNLAQIVGEVPEQRDILRDEILNVVAERRMTEITWVVAEGVEAEPINFSLMARTKGLCCGTGTWKDNGEYLLSDKVAGIRDLIAYREDVWRMVISHIANGGSAGFGLPLKIMEELRLGRYSRTGMDRAMEQMLLSIGVPMWYIGHMQKVVYAFPKSHCIAGTLTELRIAWYNKNAL